MINARTSAGVALSGTIALAITGQWRLAFSAFAAMAAVLAIAAAVSLPASNGGTDAGGLPAMNGPVLRLISASFLLRAASTAVWSFGGQLASWQLGNRHPVDLPSAWPALSSLVSVSTLFTGLSWA